ncbi:MAG: flagellar export chaperone FlgN [Desulfurivibrionaceae bacterium]
MKTNTPSEKTIKELHCTLDKQIELTEEVLAITRAEKEALVNMDEDSLFSLARSKNNKLDTIAANDTEIKQKLAEIAPDTGAGQNGSFKLLDLAPLLEADESARITKKRNRLAELRKKIINDNVVNKKFSSNVLGYIEDAISLIVNGIQENSTYNRQKQGTTETSRPALLSREI